MMSFDQRPRSAIDDFPQTTHSLRRIRSPYMRSSAASFLSLVRRHRCLLAVALCTIGATNLFAQEALRSRIPPQAPISEQYRSPSELKKLPLEQLLDVEITSASRRPEPIFQAASAIDVVTENTIQRAGVNNIPDALRLAAAVQVAQIDGHSWAISARGFNIPTANKLQVLMDGRSLYTPLFSGVFWDVQRTFLPDLEQIEVVRGPGGTLWGANAVNGVINIQTKSARETQGFLIDGDGGENEGYGGVRYGGRIGKDTYYRAYVLHESRDSLPLELGPDAGDDTRFTQGGFRIDTSPTPDNVFTLQGDGYAGTFGQLDQPDIDVDGGNIIARWSRQLAADSSIVVQSYYDRTHRKIPNVFEEHRDTFDLEVEGRFVLGQHDFVYGANYRVSADDIGNLGNGLAFLPSRETSHLISGYVQDEWHIVPKIFSLIAGSKLEWNSFSGFEIQPTGRFVWIPTDSQTLWGAISRAVRTPTRIDQDFFVPNPASGDELQVRGDRGFDSEELLAYELGYRIKPTRALSFDLAAFYNSYDNLRSEEPTPGTFVPIVLGNKLEGHSYGGTLTAKWQATDWWRIDGSFSALALNLHSSRGGNDLTKGANEANDPDNYFTIHSAIDLPGHVQFDSVLRYVDSLPHPYTPSYLTLDLRLGWSPTRNLELAIVGRNLLQDRHEEFATGRLTREVERRVFATIRWTY
jgi:iron complex outermembrane receptor protein